MNKSILEWQNSFSIFGIEYNGPKNGEINPQFIEAISLLENKFKVYGEILIGNEIGMTVEEAKNKFLVSKYKDWEKFLSQDLPVIGKIYNGDIVSSAKELEKKLGKLINTPLDNMIWNDTKKDFITTIDDIKKSLELLSKHQTEEIKSSSSIDERFFEISKYYINNHISKL